jgi:uncharacterized membrane protein
MVPRTANPRLIILHIVTTVSLLGADLTLAVLAVAAATGAQPQSIYPAASLIAKWVAAPLAVLSLGSGIALTASSRYGVVKNWWVLVKLTTTSVLAFALLLLLVPGLSNAAELAAAFPESITSAQRVRLAVAPAIAAGLLMLNAILGVYKPERARDRTYRHGSVAAKR